MILLQSLFWICVAWMCTVFVVYPIAIWILSLLRPRPIKKDPSYRPSIHMVMAAFNEESVIERRMQNYMDLDYPREKLSFSIGSDASTDKTDEIVEKYQKLDSSINFTRFERSGKTRIVYALAKEKESELIIFGDADALYDKNLLKEVASCFADETVGGVVVNVSYEDKELNAGNVGETTYHSIEDSVRRNESILKTTIGPTGQCFAVRPGAYSDLTDFRMSDDLNLAISISLNGYRVWYEHSAKVVEINKRNLWSEYGRRIRMGQQSMATYRKYEGTKWPWSSKVGLQIWIHKILRNLSAIPLLLSVVAVLLLVLLSDMLLYEFLGVGILVWIGLLIVGIVLDRVKVNIPLLGYPLYFTSMLVALTIGSLKSIGGGGLEMWSSPRID